MPAARRDIAQDLIVEALTDRLETALDFCASQYCVPKQAGFRTC